jgi:TolB-like protein/Flp pilus assembly protein TadD
MPFLAELKRRNVVKVGVAYLVIAWLVAQVVSLFAPALRLPDWTTTLVVLVLIIGLPVALLLAWVYELTPEGVKRTADVPESESITHVTSQKLNYMITGVLALVLAVVVVDNYVLDDSASLTSAVSGESSAAGTAPSALPAQTEPTPSASPVGAMLRNSIAVLPLENLSPDPNNAYIAAGLHEEILNQLAKLENLNVIARTSVLQYADDKPPIDEIARVLKVESIMEGSVRYAGDRIRVTTQLIDSRTGAHLWSETYDREFDDIFAIESDIAMNVANAMGAEFSIAEQTALETPATSSPAAYALYLQARELGRTVLPGSMETMLALLDRALELDPAFARAYAERARIYAAQFVNTNLGTAAAAGDRAALEQRVRENIEQALALDPKNPDARVVLRQVNVTTWRWADYSETLDAAEERILQAAPLWVLSWMGNHADAVRIAQKVTELNPNNGAAHVNLGVVYTYAGDRAAAIRSVERGLEIGADNLIGLNWLAYNAAALGNEDEALAHLQRLERLLGVNRPLVYLPELAYAYSRIGRSDDVARLFAEIEARATGADVGVGTWAMAYLAVGDEEESLRYLEAAAEKARKHEPDQGLLALMGLKMNFLADPRLEEPRFAEALSHIRGD